MIQIGTLVGLVFYVVFFTLSCIFLTFQTHVAMETGWPADASLLAIVPVFVFINLIGVQWTFKIRAKLNAWVKEQEEQAHHIMSGS